MHLFIQQKKNSSIYLSTDTVTTQNLLGKTDGLGCGCSLKRFTGSRYVRPHKRIQAQVSEKMDPNTTLKKKNGSGSYLLQSPIFFSVFIGQDC